KRQRTLRLPADYVAEHAHLSYAATAYGVQGATVAGSHTILTDATSAADVYVGSQVSWGLMFKTLPERPAFVEYATRLRARTAAQRAVALDDALIAQPKA
ncbi:MAG: hypothetical protein L0H23_04400, partial [Luteimonas sp.]|nr:hypothetical protein [Luteimonas sp.]